MRVIFPSLLHASTHGFVFDTDNWDYNSTPFLGHEYRMFQTYGDNLTQHSHSWAVPKEYAGDYMQSLASYIVNTPPAQVEDRLISRIHGATTPTSLEALEFAASVKYKESDKHWDKRRYFSTTLRKVAGPKAEHDKRYTEINEYHNGQPDGMFRILHSQHSYGMELYNLAHSIREYTWNRKGMMSMESPVIYLKWATSHREPIVDDVRVGFDALRAAARSLHYWESARNQLECGASNRANREVEVA